MSMTTDDMFEFYLIAIPELNLLRKHLKAAYHRPTSETPFQWRFAGGLMVDRHCVLTGSEPRVTVMILM